MLGLFVGLLATGSSLLNDPDTQWHIEIGRWIWAARSVPSTDLFSHTFQGAPWIAKEWASQLTLFAAYRAGSWSGVVVATASAIAFSFAYLHEWLRRRSHPTAALAATLVAVILAMPHFLARPHILALPIMIIWMTSLVSALERGRAPPLPFALLLTLWANLHGSFPLGLVLAGVLAGEGVLDAPPGSRIVRLRQWAVFLFASLAATAVSPYGWHAILVPLQMSGNAETLRYIDEWQPLRFDFTGSVALAALALIAAILLREARSNLFRIIAVALLAYLMIRHARFVSLFALVGPILAARAIGHRQGLAALPPSDSSPLLWRVVTALSVAAFVSAVIISPEPAADVTPEAAYRSAEANGVSGPVYNDYDFGGYLIAHGVKTFVDGRTDQLFLGAFLPELAHAIASKADTEFAALLRRYHVTWALVRAGSRDAAHLAAMPGWVKIHQDDVAAVFVVER